MVGKDLNYCRGCGHLGKGNTCDYLLHVGHSRGCPPGVGCPLHTERKKKMKQASKQASPHEAWARVKELSEELGDAGKTISSLQTDMWKAIRAGNEEEVVIELRQIGNQAMQACALYARLAAEALRAADEIPM